MATYVGLIACEDRPGLVHQITGVMFRRQMNVTENQEFVDHRGGRFFMRTQFDGSVSVQELIGELTKVLPVNAVCSVREQTPRRLVLLASQQPHCLGDLLLRYSTGELSAKILAVVSQHEVCRELTERFGLPFHCIPVKKDRIEHEQLMLETIQSLKPDYLVLARYMRIFSASFVSRFPERIINIHHSFLPAFIGQDPYHQAYERGVKIIGATAHYVTTDLDEGPIIEQEVQRVHHEHTPESLVELGRDVECRVLARAVRWHAEHRVLIEGSKTVVFA